MPLTRDFRETVQARVKSDAAYRRGLLSDSLESLLSGEIELGKELLRDYINATVGFPKLSERPSCTSRRCTRCSEPRAIPRLLTYSELWPIYSVQKASG